MLTLRNLTRTLDFAKIDELLRFALVELTGDITVNVIERDRTLDLFSNDDYELQAMLYPTMSGVYSLFVRSRLASSLEATILHETVHLQQFESGRLVISDDKKSYVWCGARYGPSCPYEQRPWEIEAFRRQGALLKAYRRAKKGNTIT